MNDLNDYEFQHGHMASSPEEPPRSRGRWIAGALLVVAAAAALYIMFGKRPLPAPAATTPGPTAVAKEPLPPLGGEAEPVAVPPLGESDPLVRTLVRALSNHPTIAAWLATDGLIRNFTVAVANIAEGVAPAKQLSALRPSAAFLVVESGGKSFIDPRSYNRYTTLADAVASVDPAGAARLYATLKPRIEEASGELGLPARRFDDVLEQAIVAVLRTPTPDRPLEVRPNDVGIGYGFVDGPLEGLSAAQKPLVRMGPRNARIIKTRLREIALALGIPAAKLPAE
jgi:hypothetical protein